MEKVKVLFVLGDDGWDGSYSETLWAEACKDGFTLDNLPFFKKGVCYQDTVVGKEISDGLLEYEKTVKKSANSLYRVLFRREKRDDALFLLRKIEGLGCIYEKNDLDDILLVAINIPGNVDIDATWKIIEMGIDNQTWEAQEGDDRHTKTRGSK